MWKARYKSICEHIDVTPEKWIFHKIRALYQITEDTIREIWYGVDQWILFKKYFALTVLYKSSLWANKMMAVRAHRKRHIAVCQPTALNLWKIHFCEQTNNSDSTNNGSEEIWSALKPNLLIAAQYRTPSKNDGSAAPEAPFCMKVR